MSDRLDDTLRDLARADAPADLSARVRVALEMRPRAAPLWPRLAAAAVVLLLAVVGALVVGDRGASTSVDTTADKEAPPPQSTVEAATCRASTSVDTAAAKEAPPPRRRMQVRTTVRPADHEHALPSLTDIAAVGPAPLSTPPMSVEATEIAPLSPIAPMDIPALDAAEGERR